MLRIYKGLFKCNAAGALSLLLPLALISEGVPAQNLPLPSRTVFKCEVGGKMVYSDSPCPGAVKLEIEPTRGMNKGTGKELIGADVSREKNQEALAEAVKPLTGMSPKQFDVQRRRFKLSAESKRECRRLDAKISDLELQEKRATNQSLEEIQTRLLASRKHFRELQC